MPTSRPSKPVIINAPRTTHHTSALSPGTPPSPKQVRFAPAGAELASRPLTSQEAWSLYHYEHHARGCHSCSSSRGPCDVGYALSRDVRVHVCRHEGELCSTRPDETGAWVRVEVPHGYDRARKMLGVERQRSRDTRKPAPIVSYDESRPSSHKREARGDVYVEPARTHRDDEKRSKHRAERYQVVEVAPASGRDHDRTYEKGGPVRLPEREREREKRGSLYERDIRRPRREYRLEERAPERKRERSRERVYRDEDREEKRERRRREKEWRDRDR